MTGDQRASDAELEARLRTLGGQIDWPPEPEVVDAVTRELRRREERPVPLPRTGRRWGRGLLIAAALLVPVAGTAIAATLVWNLGGITVDVVPPTSVPTRTLGPKELGRPIALGDALTEVGFTPIYPRSLGTPDEVYAGTGSKRYVVLAWAPNSALPRIDGSRWGAVLFEIPGDNAFISKHLFEGQVSPTTVDGSEAVWAQGEHPLELLTPDEIGTFLVTGNVLLWNEQDFAMRFESRLGEPEAIRVAEEIVIPAR